MPILGVTGPVAAGKSAFTRRLAALGARVIDVDGLGHRALASSEGRSAVVREFGAGVLLEEGGALDRQALARIAFGDETARRRLEAIVHPIVRRGIDEEIAAARAAGAALIVLDCALLFESGLEALCDRTAAVDAPDVLRFARARSAHGWDEAEVRRRDAAQLPAAEKRARADRVVVNDGDEARLERAALDVVESLARGASPAASGRRSNS